VLTVICPSRGRPHFAAEVQATFNETAADLDTKLWFIVDPDDATAAEYPNDLVEPTVQTWRLAERAYPPGMLAPLNVAAKMPEIVGDSTVIGFIGDDHRFRTNSWDFIIEDFLENNPGVAYADDLLKGQELPTQWFVSRPIVDVFGMGLPILRHLYIDDYWRTLAAGAGCLFYMPEIVIEHMHPTVGKSEWDEGYRKNNDPELYGLDGSAFRAWRTHGYDDDVAKLREIVGT
jgi:hypothetical protein